MTIPEDNIQLAMLGGDAAVRHDFSAQIAPTDAEIEAVTAIAASGQWWMGKKGHPAIRKLEASMAQSQGTSYALGVTNGTQALEIILRNLGVGTGDQVIIPAYAPQSVAMVVQILGAEPVLVDVCLGTMTLDPEALSERITPQVKAIIYVHLSGVVGAIDPVLSIAKAYDLPVVEDCRHAYGVKSKGRPVGSLGIAGAFDFQSGQMVSGGEGGVIVTQDKNLYGRCWSQHNCGRRQGRPRSEYYELGSNCRLAAFQAALIQAQCQCWSEELPQVLKNLDQIDACLAAIEGLTPQYRATKDQSPTWRYLFRYESHAFQGLPITLFIKALQAEGVPCEGSPYRGLHQILQSRDSQASFPVAERLAQTVVGIPYSIFLGAEAPIQEIGEAITKIQHYAQQLVQSSRDA
ncbi:aminotransferase class V-fold PLP-dependent enzyme [Acaryochloris sp. IP29b_bin.137]|uniref:DegT/DnrJ/EryC1/StrS family aminotransferase n=1 Tax=Acaryochloris sp. IP29b_bin.137 TaxID=2969217 RepID=UPI00260AB714|nr:aminotransferase class V-fold PLP-dependent enzyme [Acaryochloris sp. IP29b_bin.137]